MSSGFLSKFGPSQSAFCLFCPRDGHLAACGRTSPTQAPTQAADDGEPVGVLRDSPVAHLPEAEHALERVEGMLAAGAYLGLGAIGRFIGLAQRSVAMCLLVGEVLRTGRFLQDRLALTTVSAVALHPGFLAVRQRPEALAVVHVGRRGHPRVNQLRLAVHAHVAFHVEVPLIALLR